MEIETQGIIGIMVSHLPDHETSQYKEKTKMATIQADFDGYKIWYYSGDSCKTLGLKEINGWMAG